MKFKIKNKVGRPMKIMGIIFEPYEVRVLESDEIPMTSDRVHVEKIEEPKSKLKGGKK